MTVYGTLTGDDSNYNNNGSSNCVMDTGNTGTHSTGEEVNTIELVIAVNPASDADVEISLFDITSGADNADKVWSRVITVASTGSTPRTETVSGLTDAISAPNGSTLAAAMSRRETTSFLVRQDAGTGTRSLATPVGSPWASPDPWVETGTETNTLMLQITATGGSSGIQVLRRRRM